MPYQGWADGLYLVKRASPEKGVDHYAVLDIGNWLGNAYAPYPVVVEMNTTGIHANWLTSPWHVVAMATDERAALARLQQALANPNYALFGNSCEHFARYIITGKRESTQLQGAVAVAGIIGLIIVVTRAA
jgi:hypothetical protein